jgi:plasmid stabilization system protein ParE
VPEGPGDDVREVFEGSYRIMYLVQGTRIDILAVIHARRLIAWPPDDASRS